MARTTVSIDDHIFRAGEKRRLALKYRSFSAYVSHLVEKDLAERPAHVTIREEPAPKYGNHQPARGTKPGSAA